MHNTNFPNVLCSYVSPVSAYIGYF